MSNSIRLAFIISMILRFLTLVPNIIASSDIDELLSLAQQGDAKAQVTLSKKYFYGDGVEQNDEEAFKWTYTVFHMNPGFELWLLFPFENGCGPRCAIA